MKIIGVESLTNEQVDVMVHVAAPASGAMPMPQT